MAHDGVDDVTDILILHERVIQDEGFEDGGAADGAGHVGQRVEDFGLFGPVFGAEFVSQES